MKKLLLCLGVMAMLTQSVLAFRPSGWVYFNWPWAFDSSSGDWYWFKTDDTQWVNGFAAGGWRKMPQSTLATGWSFYGWPYAYCPANGSWYYINEVDTQWVVNMRTGVWTRFGQATAPVGMVLIPGGANSGSNPLGDEEPSSFDYPATYSLTVSPFYMDRYEVTKARWDEVYAWAMANGYSFDFPGSIGGKATNHPVHSVSWMDCVKWCNARSQKEGRPAVYTVNGDVYKYRINQNDDVVQTAAAGYRLPTEAEWQYAARGGVANRRYPWGNTISHSNANYYSGPYSNQYGYDASPTQDYHPSYDTGAFPFTSPVGAFAPNGYGLYDMVGNVAEWCYEWHPTFAGTDRVVRGGGWDDDADDCRIGKRGSYSAGYGYNASGFRTVLSAGQ